MIELLSSYDNVSPQILEHLMEYYNTRREEMLNLYGDWNTHDDSDLLSPEREEMEEEETPVADYQEEAQQSKHQEDSSFEMEEARAVEKLREINRLISSSASYTPYVLDKPLRFKHDNQEIHYKSLSKLKTEVVKRMYHDVVGSIHPLDALYCREIESILQSRIGEDPILDMRRRLSLYSFPGKKFKMEDGTMKFRSCSGHILWFDLKDAKYLTSLGLKQRIEDIEDFVETPEEASFVDSLRECLKELKKKEEEERRERRAQR